jgi:hypothetical protein
MSDFPPPLAGEGREGARGLNAYASVEDLPPPARFARYPPPQAGEDKDFQFARVQVCVLQMMLITQPVSSALFGPVKVNEPV